MYDGPGWSEGCSGRTALEVERCDRNLLMVDVSGSEFVNGDK